MVGIEKCKLNKKDEKGRSIESRLEATLRRQIYEDNVDITFGMVIVAGFVGSLAYVVWDNTIKPWLLGADNLTALQETQQEAASHEAVIDGCTINGKLGGKVQITCPDSNEVIIGTFHKSGQEAAN